MAAAQSQITHALLIQFEFIHHKPVMIHEFAIIWSGIRVARGVSFKWQAHQFFVRWCTTFFRKRKLLSKNLVLPVEITVMMLEMPLDFISEQKRVIFR